MNKNPGFTLLETLIAVSITIVAATFIVAILVNSTGFYYKQNSLINEGLSLNDAMREISTYLKQASSVAVGYPEVDPVYTTSAQVLVLKLPSLSPTGTIEGIYDYIVISKDSQKNNILRVIVFPDSNSTRKSANQVLTTLLDNITFNYFDKTGSVVSPNIANIVETRLTVLARTGSVSSKRTSSMTVTLRNN